MKNLMITILLGLLFKSGFCIEMNKAFTKTYSQKINDTIPLADTSHAEMQDYVTVQAGKVMIVKNKNKGTPINEDITMHDGSVVRKDGTLISKDGKTYILHEGDKVYISGIIEAPKLQ